MARRMELHRTVGAVLEELFADDLEPHLAEIAYHLSQAAPLGEAARAVEYSVRAGDRAAAVLAYEDSVRQYERALMLLAPSEATSARRAGILLRLGDARSRAGDLAARGTFEEAAEIGRGEADPELLAEAALGYARVLEPVQLGLGGHPHHGADPGLDHGDHAARGRAQGAARRRQPVACSSARAPCDRAVRDRSGAPPRDQPASARHGAPARRPRGASRGAPGTTLGDTRTRGRSRSAFERAADAARCHRRERRRGRIPRPPGEAALLPRAVRPGGGRRRVGCDDSDRRAQPAAVPHLARREHAGDVDAAQRARRRGRARRSEGRRRPWARRAGRVHGGARADGRDPMEPGASRGAPAADPRSPSPIPVHPTLAGRACCGRGRATSRPRGQRSNCTRATTSPRSHTTGCGSSICPRWLRRACWSVTNDGLPSCTSCSRLTPTVWRSPSRPCRSARSRCGWACWRRCSSGGRRPTSSSSSPSTVAW